MEALRCLVEQGDRPRVELVIAMPDGVLLPMEQAKLIGSSGIPYQVVHGSWAHITDKQNAAVAVTKGEWFTFWDDDDWSDSSRLAFTVLAIEEATDDTAFVGPTEMLYHELSAPTRHTLQFTTATPVLDKPAAIRRALWSKQPFELRARPFGGPDPGNVGDWIVRRGLAGGMAAAAEFVYIGMLHGANTNSPKAFRVDPTTRRVFDGNDYAWVGGREIVAGFMTDEVLKRYEASIG